MARLQLTVHESIIPDMHMVGSLVLESLRPAVPSKRLRLVLSSPGRLEGSRKVQPANDTDPPANDPQLEPPLHGSSSGRAEMKVPLSTPATLIQPAKRATWVSSLTFLQVHAQTIASLTAKGSVRIVTLACFIVLTHP